MALLFWTNGLHPLWRYGVLDETSKVCFGQNILTRVYGDNIMYETVLTALGN